MYIAASTMFLLHCMAARSPRLLTWIGTSKTNCATWRHENAHCISTDNLVAQIVSILACVELHIVEAQDGCHVKLQSTKAATHSRPRSIPERAADPNIMQALPATLTDIHCITSKHTYVSEVYAWY